MNIDNDPAFPESKITGFDAGPALTTMGGLTKREYFAAMMMVPQINHKLQELLCNFSACKKWDQGKRNEAELMLDAIKESRHQIAFFACLFADALIAELSK